MDNKAIRALPIINAKGIIARANNMLNIQVMGNTLNTRGDKLLGP